MYQPYPGGGSAPQPAQRPTAPRPVKIAVRLMYAGAATSVLSIVLLLAVGVSKAKIHQADPSLTPAQVNSAHTAIIAIAILEGLIGAGLWLLNAWGCNRGASWARILGSVLCGIFTLLVLLGVARSGPVVSKVFDLIPWLIGVAAVYFLWQRESSAYFNPPVT
jgi:hypothetical protein